MSTASSPSAAPGMRRNMVTVCAMTATIMQALDTTIANVALPYMQGSLSASHAERQAYAARTRWWNSTGGGSTTRLLAGQTADSAAAPAARGFAAIKAGDGKRARELCEAHLRTAGEAVVVALQEREAQEQRDQELAAAPPVKKRKTARS